MKFLHNWFKRLQGEKCSNCGHSVKIHTDTGQGDIFCYRCRFGVCE